MWKIIDDNGEIYSGTMQEMLLIWDLITREVYDLAGEYRHAYTEDQILEMKQEYTELEWSGDLHLIEIHNTISDE